MGIVHATCRVSGLGIVSHVWPDVRVVVVARSASTFEPVALPIYGDYDDYGNVEKRALLDGDRAFLAGILAMHAQGDLWWSDTAEITTDVTTANLVAVLEEIRQGMIYEAVRHDESPSRSMRVGSVSLHFVTILDRFYDRVIEMQKRALCVEERARLDEEIDGPLEALGRALGPSPVSARLLVDTPDVREALVDFRLFRSWFDAHRSWSPISTGEQLSPTDLRARAHAARTTLAEWPALLGTLERYEAQLDKG